MSITARGGYQIVDGMGGFLSEDSPFYKVPGIYNKALNQVNKPCYFGNIRIRNNGVMVDVPFQEVTFEITDSVLYFSINTVNGSVTPLLYINANDEIGLD